MLYFGIDVAILFCIGVACISVVCLVCWNRVTDVDGKYAVLSSMFTMMVMLVGYVIMSRVLDSIVGAI